MATLTMNHKTLSRLRIEASEIIHRKFGKAPVVVAQYGERGAYAHCVWNDGVKEYMYIDYADLKADNPHDQAMVYIKKIV